MKAASVEKAKKYKPKKQPLKKRLVRYWPLYVMLIPCIIYYALICYVPMAGSVLAFKDYSFKKGIWGSPWIGLKYFKTFFSSYDGTATDQEYTDCRCDQMYPGISIRYHTCPFAE